MPLKQETVAILSESFTDSSILEGKCTNVSCVICSSGVAIERFDRELVTNMSASRR